MLQLLVRSSALERGLHIIRFWQGLPLPIMPNGTPCPHAGHVDLTCAHIRSRPQDSEHKQLSFPSSPPLSTLSGTPPDAHAAAASAHVVTAQQPEESTSEDDEEDSYAVDEWEEEEEEDAVVARLANLLDGTDLRRQIRDELRRGLEE